MEELRTIVAWIYVDRSGVERALQAMIPPGVMMPLVCPEGGDDEDGVDVLARNTARRAGLKARKRRFQAVADLDVFDGRSPSPAPSPSPSPAQPGSPADDRDRD